ncbi:MAG: tubulin-like doman-containing protein [Chloroherpetonaceae bacterium]|nr:tubulin-like doman-containing protein [Chloroherpetonaceae bacterium]
MKPALYVGLGGAGTWTVAKIKKRILERERETGIKFPNAYLVMDTDDGTISNVKKDLGYDILNDVTEAVIYGKVCNPRREYEQMLEYQRTNNSHVGSAYRSMAKWIDDEVARKFPDQSLQKGASAERQKGRVGGLTSAREIMNKLRDRMKVATQLMLEYLQRNPQGETADFSFPIYLISSCLGGSGSSMFLDMCKMISIVYRDVVAQDRGGGEADIQPIIYLPDPYLEKYARGNEAILYRYMANAFAFFAELDFFFYDRYFAGHVPGQEGKRIYELYLDSEENYFKTTQNLSWQPFKAAKLVDSQLLGAQLQDIGQMYDLVSEMMAQLATTPVAYNAIQSKFDNQKGQIGIHPSLDTQTGMKLARAYAVMGYRVLEFPKEPMRKYFLYRFLAESFEGLIGKSYDQIEGAAFRESEVRAKLEQLERFIYAELASKADVLEIGANKVPHNFETAIRAAIKPFTEKFTTERFWTEKALEKGEEDFDKKKVSDSELSEHLKEAKDIVRKFRTYCNDRILEGTDENSRQGIIAALDNELQRIFIDAVMTFGVNYASRLLERLDASLELKLTKAITALQETKAEQERKNAEIATLKDEALKEVEKTFGGKWKEKLQDYHAAIMNLLELAEREYLLEARIKLLEYLCKGEDGLLDKYERIALSLAKLFSSYYQGDANREGFKRRFENQLLKEFQETASLLTVQYLPNISEYVTDTGEWKDEMLLSKLYERFVALEKRPGESRKAPVRYFSDELPSAEQRDVPKDRLPSLAKRLREILSRFGEENFSQLGRPEVEMSRQEKLMEEWIELSKAAVEEWMALDSKVTNEIQMPLIERFNALSQEEQQKASRLFTMFLQPLCPQNRMNDTPNRVVVVASDNKAFAERIYPNTGTVEYPQDPTLKNKVVGFILESGFTRDDFRQITALHGIYEKHREEYRPHLWKVANEFGIKGLMGDFSQNFALDWVCDALIYNFLVSKLTPEQKADIFFKDSKTGEDEAVERGPIHIMFDKGRNLYQVFYLAQAEEKNGKMLLRKKFYQPLTEPKTFVDYDELLERARKARLDQKILTRYQDGFADLMRHGHFRANDVHEWVEKDYREGVLAKRIRDFRSKDEKAQVDAVTKISNHIHERLEKLFPKVAASVDSEDVVVTG